MSKEKTDIMEDKYKKTIINADSHYIDSVNVYLQLFCEKQGYDFEDAYWIGGKYGEICEVADMYYSFVDIKTDMDMCAPKGHIQEWYHKSYDAHFANVTFPNYENYLKMYKGINK